MSGLIDLSKAVTVTVEVRDDDWGLAPVACEPDVDGLLFHVVRRLAADNEDVSQDIGDDLYALIPVETRRTTLPRRLLMETRYVWVRVTEEHLDGMILREEFWDGEGLLSGVYFDDAQNC